MTLPHPPIIFSLKTTTAHIATMSLSSRITRQLLRASDPSEWENQSSNPDVREVKKRKHGDAGTRDSAKVKVKQPKNEEKPLATEDDLFRAHVQGILAIDRCIVSKSRDTHSRSARQQVLDRIGKQSKCMRSAQKLVRQFPSTARSSSYFQAANSMKSPRTVNKKQQEAMATHKKQLAVEKIARKLQKRASHSKQRADGPSPALK
jgi:hypothetical protein